MPPRTCKPHRQLTNVGYVDVNETEPHRPQA
ncbi:hypothetical protein ML5_6008 [Micromonospora sp. L5]|nr:hypothetical protein ML5_6008 [Micromonospora sp. L5]